FTGRAVPGRREARVPDCAEEEVYRVDEGEEADRLEQQRGNDADGRQDGDHGTADHNPRNQPLDLVAGAQAQRNALARKPKRQRSSSGGSSEDGGGGQGAKLAESLRRLVLERLRLAHYAEAACDLANAADGIFELCRIQL